MKTRILALVFGLSTWLFSVASVSALLSGADVTQALQWDHAMVFPQADTISTSLFDWHTYPISMGEPFSSMDAADLHSAYAYAESSLDIGAQDWTYVSHWFAGCGNWFSAGADEHAQLNGGGLQDPMATPVPEPATLLLFGMGLIFSAAIFRQKFI